MSKFIVDSKNQMGQLYLNGISRKYMLSKYDLIGSTFDTGSTKVEILVLSSK